MNIFDPHISGSLSVSGSGEISNNLLVSGNLNVLGTINGSVSGNITSADTASFAPKYTLTSSFNTFTSSYNTGSFTGSFKGDGSNLYNIPASGVTGLNLNNISGALSITGSIIPNGNFLYDLGSETNSFRDLYISTGSIRFHNPDGTEQGRITVDRSSGDISILKTAGLTNIQKATISQGNINPNFLAAVSASNLFVHNKIVMPLSGTINGINLIAFSSSIATTDGNQNTRLNSIESTSGSLNTFTSSASGRLTSLESTSSSIRLDFNSFTSSYNTVSGSINNRLGGLESFSGSYTGSFSGSFKGDGTNLYNIPASGVTGLNLTRIADGAATASISNTNGLRVNSNTEITGTLKLNKVNLGSNNIVDITLTDGGGKYFINGVRAPRLSFIKGFKYRFYYNNIGQHPLRFSLIDNGRHNGGTEYTTGVTTNADPFYIEVDVTDDTPTTFYYYCDFHVGMGNSITVYSDFLHGQSNIGLINVDTTALATTGSNNFTNIQRTSGSLVVTGSVDVSGSHNVTGSVNITGSITLNGQAIGTGKLDETTFQAYTSSNDGRLFAIENSTSSYNTFTSSIDTRIKNEMNEENVISGSIQVILTGTTGYSTFSSSVSTSIGALSSSVSTTTSGLSSSIGSLSSSLATTTSGLTLSISSLSSSVATTTSGLSSSIGTTSSSFSSTNDTQNGRLNSIETSTGSLNTFTSSIDTTIKNKLNTESVISGSIQVNITGTTGYNTFSSSVSTSIGALSSSVSTTTSGLSSSVGSISSSLSSTNDTQNNRLGSIETSTGSLNLFTSSIDTTIKNKLNTESVVSGSAQVLITGTTGYSTFSSSVSTSIGALSSSVGTAINGLSSSVATTTNELSSSIATTTSGLTLSISSLSSSVATTTSGLSSSIGSLSSSVATVNLGQNNRLDSIEGKTGSYATTGSNTYQGSQTITGSLYISENLIVAGSSSIQHISSSIVNIADNIITVNAQNPAVRFGGLAVIDSGSSPQVSGSLLFDATENEWIFVHQNQASVTSALLIMGPETFDDLGNEIHLTNNKLVKSTIDEHIGDSNITDTGTNVSINSNTEVTGTLKVTGVIGGPTITAIETSTGSLNTFTSSLLTAIELTGSNLTVKGNLLVKGTTTNVNTSTLDVDNNLINLNGAGAANAGLRVKDTTGVSQLSGSLLWDATNDYWIAGQLGSEQRLVRETEFNTQITRINNVETSTGSLNSFTSSINTTIKSKLNSDGVISGSVQVNHNATTNYDANQHVDHTAISISAGSGLSGGGTIAATRTITLDTGSVHFLDGVKKELNTEGVISGSSQVLSGTGIWSGSAQLPSGVVSGSSQVLSGTGIWSGSAQLPSGVVSGSSQVLAGTTIHSGAFFNGISVVSGSAQISFNGITDKPALVSGSAQISFSSITDKPALVSGSAQISFSSITDKPALVSGSAQITLSSTTGYGSVLNQALLTTSSPTFSAVSATTFTGALSGNATTATTAGALTSMNISQFTNNSGYITGINSSAVTTALGFTPYNATNPSGYISSITSGNVTTALGYTPYNATNPSGFISSITSGNVTTALGFTPYNATNPSGYITGISFANVSAKPTTISGYGITDAITTGNIGSQSVSYASTAGSADTIDGVGFRNTGSNSSVAANTLDSNGMTYVTDVDGSSTNLTGNATDGALYSQIYSSSWQHQIYGDYRTGIMYVRGKNNGTWAGWKRVALSSATTFSSVSSLTFTHNLGTANVTAQVFDTNGDMFFPSNIRVSSTQVIVTFASARSGRLVVTG